MKHMIAILAAALAVAGAARAEVTDSTPAGFEVVERAEVAAPQAKVYAAILDVGRWWGPAHSYTHDSRNLSIDLAKGCFCEKLPQGLARHMENQSYDGGSCLILSGALGPLVTTGAIGHMAFTLKTVGDKTRVLLTYDVGGYAKGGFGQWTGLVEQEQKQQLGRLKNYV